MMRSFGGSIFQMSLLCRARLTEESLERMMPLRAAKVKLALLMQHAVNHSTYHRGQVSLMMRQVGAKPVATDLQLFLLERAE
jgi:uncharacterized damage-inducible protein DinB